jgi:hypothetical protein
MQNEKLVCLKAHWERNVGVGVKVWDDDDDSNALDVAIELVAKLGGTS